MEMRQQWVAEQNTTSLRDPESPPPPLPRDSSVQSSGWEQEKTVIRSINPFKHGRRHLRHVDRPSLSFARTADGEYFSFVADDEDEPSDPALILSDPDIANSYWTAVQNTEEQLINNNNNQTRGGEQKRASGSKLLTPISDPSLMPKLKMEDSPPALPPRPDKSEIQAMFESFSASLEPMFTPRTNT
jgi:hypothetical protein